MATTAPKKQDEWLQALNELPTSPENIPAFFFAHSSPIMELEVPNMPMAKNGALPLFLKDFGDVLLKKYQPEAVVVFSAHWDNDGEILVSDYGNENPLYYDYYRLPDSFYQLEFKSRGDSELSRRIVELYKKAGLTARTTTVSEHRRADGPWTPSSGFDHGVFIPFRKMFGLEMGIPIVQVSIDSSFDPEKEWKIGRALDELRHQGILLLSGGLTIHNLGDRSSLHEPSPEIYSRFDNAVTRAVQICDPQKRKGAMFDLVRHEGFEASHPTAEHFVPIYVAGGAGEDGKTKVVAAIHGALTVAFGL